MVVLWAALLLFNGLVAAQKVNIQALWNEVLAQGAQEFMELQGQGAAIVVVNTTLDDESAQMALQEEFSRSFATFCNSTTNHSCAPDQASNQSCTYVLEVSTSLPVGRLIYYVLYIHALCQGQVSYVSANTSVEYFLTIGNFSTQLAIETAYVMPTTTGPQTPTIAQSYYLLMLVYNPASELVQPHVQSSFNHLFVNYCSSKVADHACQFYLPPANESCTYLVQMHLIEFFSLGIVELYLTSVQLACANTSTQVPAPILVDFFKHTSALYPSFEILQVLAVPPHISYGNLSDFVTAPSRNVSWHDLHEHNLTLPFTQPAGKTIPAHHHEPTANSSQIDFHNQTSAPLTTASVSVFEKIKYLVLLAATSNLEMVEVEGTLQEIFDAQFPAYCAKNQQCSHLVTEACTHVLQFRKTIGIKGKSYYVVSAEAQCTSSHKYIPAEILVDFFHHTAAMYAGVTIDGAFAMSQLTPHMLSTPARPTGPTKRPHSSCSVLMIAQTDMEEAQLELILESYIETFFDDYCMNATHDATCELHEELTGRNCSANVTIKNSHYLFGKTYLSFCASLQWGPIIITLPPDTVVGLFNYSAFHNLTIIGLHPLPYAFAESTTTHAAKHTTTALQTTTTVLQNVTTGHNETEEGEEPHESTNSTHAAHETTTPPSHHEPGHNSTHPHESTNATHAAHETTTPPSHHEHGHNFTHPHESINVTHAAHATTSLPHDEEAEEYANNSTDLHEPEEEHHHNSTHPHESTNATHAAYKTTTPSPEDEHHHNSTHPHTKSTAHADATTTAPHSDGQNSTLPHDLTNATLSANKSTPAVPHGNSTAPSLPPTMPANSSSHFGVNASAMLSTTSLPYAWNSSLLPELLNLAELIVLELQSKLEDEDLEMELEFEFESRFEAFCNHAANAHLCDGYVRSHMHDDDDDDDDRRRRRHVRQAQPQPQVCQYNFVILNSSLTGVDHKTLTMLALYICEHNMSQIPAPLLSDFFQQSPDQFTQMSVLSAHPVAVAAPTGAPTSTAQATIVYQVVYDNSYFIATVILGVFSGICLLAILIYLAHYCMVGKYEREAFVQLLRSVNARRHYGTLETPDTPEEYRRGLHVNVPHSESMSLNRGKVPM